MTEKNRIVGYAIAALAIVGVMVAVYWSIFVRPLEKAGPKEAQEVTKDFKIVIEREREIVIQKDGDIHDKKEAEIRGLSDDVLVSRHLAALYRFGGVSGDRASSGGVGGP